VKTLYLGIIVVVLITGIAIIFSQSSNAQMQNNSSTDLKCMDNITQDAKKKYASFDEEQAKTAAINYDKFKSEIKDDKYMFRAVSQEWTNDQVNCTVTLKDVLVLFFVTDSSGKQRDVTVIIDPTSYMPQGIDVEYDVATHGGVESITANQIDLPLKQFRSGTLAQDVKCRDGLSLVIKTEDGSPACVKPENVSKLLIRGWAILNLKDFGVNQAGRGPVTLEQTSPPLKTNQTVNPTAQIIPSCVSQIPHQYAIAGPPGASLCPIINFEASGKILNATGFYGIYNYTAYPGTLNFVLEQGHNGTITYLISINAIHNFDGNSWNPNEINITNDVVFMHDAGMNNHPGVDVLVEPKSEIIGNNGSALATMTFSASKAALPGTYWATLPPGVCMGGEMIILTITDCTK
jgi:hypothetical protein